MEAKGLGEKIPEEKSKIAPKTSIIFLIVGAISLVLLVGGGLLLWQMKKGELNAYKKTYGYTGSKYASSGGLCGCCSGKSQGGQRASSESAEDILKDAEKAGLSYYAKTYKDASVSAKATDYGCHIQVDIYKGGKVVKSLGYDRASGIYEIN